MFNIELESYIWRELEKWSAIRANVGGVPACVAGEHGWRANVDGMGGVLAWVVCYYYCQCYY